MLGIPTYDQGSVAAGAHVVARTFLSGLAAELQTVVPPTTGGTDRVKEFDERFFGMDIEAALNKITELNHEAFAQGLRESTQATYDSGVRSYEYFCGKYGFRPYPTCEKTLIAFVGWSAVRVTVGSINNYLSGIRSKHIECDLPWVNRSEMPRLQRHLNGFEWMEKATKDGRLRLPLTHKILANIIETKWTLYQLKRNTEGARFVEPSIYSMDHPATAQAVYSTAFGHFMRPGEISVRNTSKGVRTEPLRLKHHQWLYDGVYPAGHEVEGQRIVVGQSINLPRAKTDQFGERSDRAAGIVPNSSMCSVSNSMRYFNLRTYGGTYKSRQLTFKGAGEVLTPDSFLFPIDDGKGGLRPLSYEDLTTALQNDLLAAGYDATHYKGHSFRIGAATTMAFNGVPDHVIKDMGGWSRDSKAFYLYVGKAPQEVRIHMSAFLARAYVPDPAYQALEQVVRP
jgi:hypothetical protein